MNFIIGVILGILIWQLVITIIGWFDWELSGAIGSGIFGLLLIFIGFCSAHIYKIYKKYKNKYKNKHKKRT